MKQDTDVNTTDAVAEQGQQGLGSETLKKAFNVLYGDRLDTYGHPADTFPDIAKIWSIYLSGQPDLITPHDVALMMALFKIVRTRGSNKHKDNAVDICGYAAIFNDMLGER